ncbi:MAG: formate dehydrogenase subunit gamma [Xanthobacteraceae bacterium]|nr:formate dehydrogenase subunit gamma [Xanthobacteraceae bacterium]QYK46223.1 MAG: formate dehydrogenase subunit gamma [Xanthobacteraceae bacterium]
MGKYESWNETLAREIIARHAARKGALLPILHDVQHTFGYVPEVIIPIIAEALNISRAEVHGTFTFYHDFRHEPAGQHVLKFCRAEACQAAGGDHLCARAEQKLGVKIGETTADDRVTFEPIYCLGLCSVAPSAMLDGKIYGRLDEARVDQLVAEAKR